MGKPGHAHFKDEYNLVTIDEDSLVNDSFPAPRASGCGGTLAFLVEPAINAELGLPVAAGGNEAILNGTIQTANAPAVQGELSEARPRRDRLRVLLHRGSARRSARAAPCGSTRAPAARPRGSAAAARAGARSARPRSSSAPRAARTAARPPAATRPPVRRRPAVLAGEHPRVLTPRGRAERAAQRQHGALRVGVVAVRGDELVGVRSALRGPAAVALAHETQECWVVIPARSYRFAASSSCPRTSPVTGFACPAQATAGSISASLRMLARACSVS